jgi:glycosyltransferase involved in cell wall biosynthesis
MRVALEATVALARRFTGVQRYILDLSRALAALHVEGLECRVLLRFADFRKRGLKPDFPWPVRWYCSGPWPAVPRCDVLHGLGVRLPRTPQRVTRISTFHDMSPLSLPHYGSQRSLRNTLRRFAHAVRCADRIIAVSQATKADFLHYYDYPEQQVDVVHLGVSPAFLGAGAAAPEEPRSAARDNPPYFVAFGGNPRKNLTRIIRAFGHCSLAHEAQLRVVGALDASDREAWQQTGLKDQLRLEPNVDDEAMARLYRESSGLLYPSLIEGFGLPILEAMACRVPVLTSARPGTAEIAGGHAILVDPESDEAIAAGIERLPQVGSDVLRAAARYAGTFTWRRTAEQTLAAYRRANKTS